MNTEIQQIVSNCVKCVYKFAIGDWNKVRLTRIITGSRYEAVNHVALKLCAANHVAINDKWHLLAPGKGHFIKI